MPVERLDQVPNLYAYSVTASLLPIREVQEELFTLYMRHIHPIFPVVDECRFVELHRRYKGREQLMDPAEFMVYHAILVAGFSVRYPSAVCIKSCF
jgi:hypothetical protein